MPARRTYLDSGVLITAWQGTDDIYTNAMSVLDDTDRAFVISDFIRLETVPKPIFLNNPDEVAFMEKIFARAAVIVESSSALTAQAVKLACKYNLAPVDALHISAALTAKVDEFITSEKSTKPLFRVTELQVTSLRTA